MLTLVSTGDNNINILDRLISVNKGNSGKVDIRGLNQSLSISISISNNQKTGLHKLLLDLIGESTRGETTRDSLNASKVGELKDGPLSELTGGDDGDILGLVDGDDGTGSQHQLLPGLLEVDDVATWCGGRGERRREEGGGRKGGREKGRGEGW